MSRGRARRIADGLTDAGLAATWGSWDRAGIRLAAVAPRRQARLTYRDLKLRVGFDSFLQVDLQAAQPPHDAASDLRANVVRDVRRLRPEWRLDQIRAFDLFPQTPHVETVLRLTRT